MKSLIKGYKKPPEDACPPGPNTQITGWGWKPSPTSGDVAGGARGANRVVKIKGYVGVKGYFTEPEMELSPDLTHKNKPTFYLGVDSANVWGSSYLTKGATASDAGFQWETTVDDSPENGYPGWKLFHRITIPTGYRNPDTQERISGAWELWTNTESRIAENFLVGATLNYHIRGDKKATLSSSVAPPLGPFSTSLPTNADGKIRLDTVFMRRAVGLTQVYANPKLKLYGSAGQESLAIMDGSIVKKLNFS